MSSTVIRPSPVRLNFIERLVSAISFRQNYRDDKSPIVISICSEGHEIINTIGQTAKLLGMPMLEFDASRLKDKGDRLAARFSNDAPPLLSRIILISNWTNDPENGRSILEVALKVRQPWDILIIASTTAPNDDLDVEVGHCFPIKQWQDLTHIMVAPAEQLKHTEIAA